MDLPLLLQVLYLAGHQPVKVLEVDTVQQHALASVAQVAAQQPLAVLEPAGQVEAELYLPLGGEVVGEAGEAEHYGCDDEFLSGVASVHRR